MAEEAVIRIVLEGSGATSAQATTSSSSSTTSQSSPQSAFAKAAKQAQAAQAKAARTAYRAALRSAKQAQTAAAKMVRAAQVAANKQSRIAAQAAKAAQTASARAARAAQVAADKEAKRIAREAKAAQREADREAKRLAREAKAAATAAARAAKKAQADADREAKRLAREAKSAAAAADREAKKKARDAVRATAAENRRLPKVTRAFDPQREARLKRIRDIKRAQTELAYRREFGEKSWGSLSTEPGGGRASGILGSIIDVATSLRGTLGGLSGVIVGSVLDVVRAFRRASTEADKNARIEALANAPMPFVPTAPGAIPSVLPAPEKGLKPSRATVLAARNVPTAVTEATVPPEKGTTGAVQSLGESAVSLSSKMSSLVPVVGALAAAVIVAGKAIIDIISNMEERYAPYSAQMSSAQAMAEVRREMNSIRRAQEMGPEMARYIEMKSNLQEKFEEVKIRIMMKILPIVTSIGSLIEALMPAAEDIADVIRMLLNPLSIIAGAANEIAAMQRDDRIPEAADPTNILLGPVGGNGAGPGPVVPQL